MLHSEVELDLPQCADVLGEGDVEFWELVNGVDDAPNGFVGLIFRDVVDEGKVENLWTRGDIINIFNRHVSIIAI